MQNTKTQQLTVQAPQQVSFPTPQEWGQISQIAASAFKSGLLPTAIKNVEAATIVALKAWELGLPPMMAYSHIHIISGKPTLSAELMQALVRKNLPGVIINILESTDQRCEIQLTRPEKGETAIKFAFTLEDAKKANLLNKDVWKQYPKAMLFSRCMSAILRAKCPDALMGIAYTPEELGASVDVGGNIIETTGKAVPEEKQKEPEPQPQAPVAGVIQSNAEGLGALFKTIKETKVSADTVAKYCKENYHVNGWKDLNNQQLQEVNAWIVTVTKQEPQGGEWESDVDMAPPGLMNPHEIK